MQMISIEPQRSEYRRNDDDDDDDDDNHEDSTRGVQYVHWVMHKCIMVKVGGEEKYT